MRGYRNKILMAIAVLVVLAVAFLYDTGSDAVPKPSTTITQEQIEKPIDSPSATPEQKDEVAKGPEQSEAITASKQSEEIHEGEQTDSSKGALVSDEPVSHKKEEAAGEASVAATSKMPKTEESQNSPTKAVVTPTPEETTSEIVPEVTDELTCTISIRCNTILDNLSKLDPDKVKIVPADGVILAEQTVTFKEGENVFDVLMRVTRDQKIHMEYVSTPVYKSAYIEGIANLYEFDCGELSGWQYKVNDVFPSFGCSRYIVEPGDKIEWVYTCDLGKDVGGYQELSEE